MATLNLQVSASSDDAREAASTVTINGTTMTIGGSGQYIGARFLNVTIPSGSTISSATFEGQISGGLDDPDVYINAEAVDDATTFTTGSSNISSRSRTTAEVTWTATNVGTGWIQSPDISSVIQEIVNRGGWSSGNDINIILRAKSAGSNYRITAYDNAAGDAPKLNITYTEPGAGQPTAARWRQVPGMGRPHGHQGW